MSTRRVKSASLGACGMRRGAHSVTLRAEATLGSLYGKGEARYAFQEALRGSRSEWPTHVGVAVLLTVPVLCAETLRERARLD